MNDPSRGEFGGNEGEERPEEHVVKLEEVARPDVRRVIVEECGPCLAIRTGWTRLPHILLHGSLGNLDAELEQLAAVPLGTRADGCRPRPITNRTQYKRAGSITTSSFT